MKRAFSYLLLLSFLSLSAFAQKDVLITIGERKFTKAEFEQIYRKNNSQLSNDEDVKTPEDYIGLFVDYKLKVIEAENRGMDTAQDFIEELAGYRDELAKPYLTEVTVTDSIVRVAYYRSVNEIRASHILLNVDPNSTPQDTLEIYNRLIEIRNQFINGEKSFNELAVEYSNDPSAQRNLGDLGYFKAFSMITEFEDVAYNTPVGEVSMPVRTKYGYHIIHVTDSREYEGEVKVAHIMMAFENSRDVSPETDMLFKQQADSIYNELKKGADFGEMVKKYSGDKSTVDKGGEMQWINRTFHVEEFIDASYALKIGELSEPVRTAFGWHIIKLIDIRKAKSFEEMENELTDKVKRDPIRSLHSKNAYYDKKRLEYEVKSYDENIAKFVEYLNEQGTTLDEIAPNILALPLHRVNNIDFTVKDFMGLQVKKKGKSEEKFLTRIVLTHIDLFADEVIDCYEIDQLEDNKPEFKQIMQEYRDGMLLFAIMQEEVWNKASTDTLGLQKYYEANKGKYLWGEHFAGMVIRTPNKVIKDSCIFVISQGIEDIDELLAVFNSEEVTRLRITKGKWEKGENERIDHMVFDGKEPQRFNPDIEFVHGKVIPAGTHKTLDEARGLYISDYQKVLEDEWMKYLRAKYKVKVNKRLLKSIEKL
jgi:peptidyl-prolyl cis-trans isomerase SurA